MSRYLQRLKRIPEESKASQWLAFLNNHREVIAAFDFLTVPTHWFRTLYCFFAIEHHRRCILQFNVTFHPTSDWIVQQLREAFPLPCPYRYVLFDNDAKFGNDVLQFLRSSDLTPVRTSIASPWQNGTAERWVGSARRELFDHVIPLNEYHLGGLGAHTFPTNMQTEPTLPWTRALPQKEQSSIAQWVEAISSLHRDWAVFIIGITGLKRRDRCRRRSNLHAFRTCTPTETPQAVVGPRVHLSSGFPKCRSFSGHESS